VRPGVVFSFAPMSLRVGVGRAEVTESSANFGGEAGPGPIGESDGYSRRIEREAIDSSLPRADRKPEVRRQ
jgi:hypothetical protein